MKRFVYDLSVDAENICNLLEDRKRLINHVRSGHHVVFFGRRNTGKTSLLVNIVIPDFKKHNPKGIAIYCDFMGVRSLKDINNRLRNAYEEAMSHTFPTTAILKSMGKILKGVRPTMAFDESGNPKFSLGIDEMQSDMSFSDILGYIGKQHKKSPFLLIFDEFQDVSFVSQAEALLRSALQFLPGDLPIIVSGSKKHLLSKIFATANAPLAGWGVEMEISTITSNDYLTYINERFEPRLHINKEEVILLQQLCLNIPEAINITCDQLLRTKESKTKINKKIILDAFQSVIEARRGRYEEYLVRFSEEEQILLKAIAIHQPIKYPQGKKFLRTTPTLSASGVNKIINRFEDEALVYRTTEGYQLGDPILAGFLSRFR